MINAGDKIAVVSPSSGLSFLFPEVYQLGVKRLRELFELEVVEFPCKTLEVPPEKRAEDINNAFKDSSIKAIIATIGGNDQIRILPYLDSDLISKNPKPFFGYSDNTNLHLYLWKLGIPSYYGANLMCQFAMQNEMHAYTVDYLKRVLFHGKIGQVKPSSDYTDADLEWSNPSNLTKKRPLYPSEGWEWHNMPQKIIQGKLWGGCLEVLDMHFSLKKYLPTFEDIILFVETSEEMPNEGFVYRFFSLLAELGILEKLKGILVGRPKAQFLGKSPPEGKDNYITNQKNAVKKALKDYKCPIPTIFNLDFGHTDPQFCIPSGGRAIIDGIKRTLEL